MFSWIGGTPDHPMLNVAAAKRLLAEMPDDDPLLALEEIAAWMASFAGSSGFKYENRVAVAMLLDETGAPIYAEVQKKYTAESHLQDLEGMKLWRVLAKYAEARGETYAACLREWPQSNRATDTMKDQAATLAVRFLHAVNEQLKLDLMRYLDIHTEIWQSLCKGYRFAEALGVAERMVIPYSGRVIHTSPQREWLSALVLYESSPGALSSIQIEMGSRLTSRLSGFFDLAQEYSATTPYMVELDDPAAPRWLDKAPEPGVGKRFFGASRAVARLDEIIRTNERGQVDEETRLDSEFTPEGKLTVLKHLHTYWGSEHVHRLQERRAITTEIEVVHSLYTISKLAKHMDPGLLEQYSEEERAKLKQQTGMGLEQEKIEYDSELWPVVDISLKGIGGIVPRTAGNWVKAGALCGLKGRNTELWWVGMIRRLKTDGQGKLHVGIEILTRKPLAVWLRVLGRGAERVSSWETSSGSFSYDYLPVILIPDENNSYANATLLMQSGNFVSGTLFEAMLGEKSRNIKLLSIIAEGDDYEQVSFQWM